MMRREHVASNRAGFTIVELMVATLVFSVILVVITSGVIHFTTDYYKGVNTSATQTAARNIANIIAQNLQYGGGEDTYDGSQAASGYICVGATRIDYNLGHQLNKGPAPDYGVLVSADNCSHAYPPLAGSQPKEYLGPNMRVTNINVTQVSGATNNLYKISVGVAYGDDDLLCFQSGTAGLCSSAPGSLGGVSANQWNTNGKSVRCRSGAGSQFCAIAHLSTEVVSRFGH